MNSLNGMGIKVLIAIITYPIFIYFFKVIDAPSYWYGFLLMLSFGLIDKSYWDKGE
jgi:hypothetical protein